MKEMNMCKGSIIAGAIVILLSTSAVQLCEGSEEAEALVKAILTEHHGQNQKAMSQYVVVPAQIKSDVSVIGCMGVIYGYNFFYWWKNNEWCYKVEVATDGQSKKIGRIDIKIFQLKPEYLKNFFEYAAIRPAWAQSSHLSPGRGFFPVQIQDAQGNWIRVKQEELLPDLPCQTTQEAKDLVMKLTKLRELAVKEEPNVLPLAEPYKYYTITDESMCYEMQVPYEGWELDAYREKYKNEVEGHIWSIQPLQSGTVRLEVCKSMRVVAFSGGTMWVDLDGDKLFEVVENTEVKGKKDVLKLLRRLKGDFKCRYFGHSSSSDQAWAFESSDGAYVGLNPYLGYIAIGYIDASVIKGNIE